MPCTVHKQMSICADFGRVFEIGPGFKAEDSNTHMHLCEFTGIDVEMEIKKHYSEVMDIVDRLFVRMFDSLNKKCKKELKAVAELYPFKPLKAHNLMLIVVTHSNYVESNCWHSRLIYSTCRRLRLKFEQGVQMLKDAGMDVDPLGDLNMEAERELGQLVLEKCGTEFYILYRYPLAVRPFYTMPCPEDDRYNNAFDVFIRGNDLRPPTPTDDLGSVAEEYGQVSPTWGRESLGRQFIY